MFEDLGRPRPAEALTKAELARKIVALIEKRGLTQDWGVSRIKPQQRS